MRAVSFLAAAIASLALACAPKVHPDDNPYDLDDPRAADPATPAPAPAYEDLPVAPVRGPVAREGTVERATLAPTLDAGPAALLRHLEVAAELDGDRFVGWRLVALDPQHHGFDGVDLAPGDVLLSVNGRSLSRPDELQAVWDGLRSASAIVADLRRGDARLQLRWTITGAPLPAPAAPRP